MNDFITDVSVVVLPRLVGSEWSFPASRRVAFGRSRPVNTASGFVAPKGSIDRVASASILPMPETTITSSGYLPVVCKNRRRRAHRQTHMGTFVVIDLDRFTYGRLCLLARAELLIERELRLQDTIDAFGNRILIDVSIFRHAHYPAANFLYFLAVFAAVILQTVVRMMDQKPARGASRQRHPEGTQCSVQRQAQRDVIADDLSRIQIGDQGQVGKPLRQTQIRDVSNENMARICGDDVTDFVVVQATPPLRIRRCLLYTSDAADE